VPLTGFPDSSPPLVVRVSTARLAGDLENAQWFFLSILLFVASVFVVFTRYVSKSIVDPLERIGRAALELADGEPKVEVPRTGDREIDELGELIAQLGSSRRSSRVMSAPRELLRDYAAGATFASRKREASTVLPAPDTTDPGPRGPKAKDEPPSDRPGRDEAGPGSPR